MKDRNECNILADQMIVYMDSITQILAGDMYFDLCHFDELEVHLIHGKHNTLLLYHGDILLRKWCSYCPVILECFFEEETINDISTEDWNWLSYFCEHHETADENDLGRIRTKEWKKRKDIQNRAENEKWRKLSAQISKDLGEFNNDMIKYRPKPSGSGKWWDKKAQRR